MKKKHLLGFLFSIFAFMFLSACNSPTAINVNFKDEEYLLSLDESIDFFDEFNLNGKDASQFDLVSADESIVDETEDGLFVAKSSGETFIKATFRGSVVAQVKVKVKYKFSAPSNLNIDELGRLSWTASSVSRNGKHEKARKYSLSYALIENGEVGKVTTKTVTTVYEEMNHLSKGVYRVTVQALAHSDDYQESDIVQEDVNYGAMGKIENVSLTNETLGGVATLTWSEKDSAVYDIYVEGFKVAQDLEEETFTHDYSIYPTAQTIKVEVIAKPTGEKQAVETSTHLNLSKLSTPGVSVSDGLVQLTNVSGASGYVLKGEDPVGTIELEEGTFDFEGFEAGIYSFSALASGSKVKEDGLYLNSASSTELTVGKLPLPKYSINITNESKVMVSFEKPVFNGEEFDVVYKITCNGLSVTLNSKTSAAFPLATTLFPAGSYDVMVELFPLEGESITDENGLTTNLLVKSDPVTTTFYKLDQFGQINHSLDGNKSIISFDKIRYATDYQLTINDVLYTEAAFVEKEGRIEFTIEDFDKRVPKDNKYVFKIFALAKEGQNLVSTVSEAEKIVEILPNTTQANYQNGNYNWQPIPGAVYAYEVFETDKTGAIIQNKAAPVLWENETSNTQTKQPLRSGYYLINVYVLSGDENNYLDANFYDKSVVWTDRFMVTTIIETPEFTFFEEDGKYKLDITSVEYGGKYEIFVDGDLDGTIYLQEKIWNEDNPGHIEYELDDELLESKTYAISVSASAGDLYDTALHTSSQAGVISLTRVEQTEVEVVLGKDVYGRVKEHMLNAEAPENVVDIKAYRGTGADRSEVLIGYDAVEKIYWLNMADVNIYGSDFSLYFVNKAKENEARNYFIDSVEKKVDFQRLATPTNVEYNNGILSFDNNDTRTKNYAINITITRNVGGSDENFFYTFEHSSTSVNLQQMVEQLCTSNMAFKTAFKNMDYLSVSVTALQNKNIAGLWVLPSFESSSVAIENLDAVSVSFDWASKTVSWTGGVAGGKYDLYINNNPTPAMVDLTNSQITLSEITGLDLSTIQEINIISKHAKYFDSKLSNSIKVKQLDAVKRVDIAKDGTTYNASLIIPSDNTSVEKVLVNGTEAPFSAGGARAEFEVSVNDSNYTITLKAKETTVDGVYYLSSDPVAFACKKIGDVQVSRTATGEIKWDDPSKDVMKGNSAHPYIFEVTFKDGNVETTITTDDLKLTIEEIESIFNLDLDDTTGEFEIYVRIKFVQNYTLDLTQGAIGLVGEGEPSVVIKPSKLISVNDVQAEVVDLETTSWVDRKARSVVKFTFTDHWNSFANAMLHAVIGEKPINTLLKNTSIDGDYSLAKTGSVWTLTVPIAHFDKSPIDIYFAVTSVGNVMSDTRKITLTRFDQVGQITMSPEGIVTIDDSQTGASYAVELNFNGSIKSATFEQDEISSIDFTTTDWLGGFSSGDYTITVVAYDKNNNIIPSFEKQTYTAHQYKGINEVYVDDHGRIALALDEDSFDGAIFTAKTVINGQPYLKEIVLSQETPDSGKTGYKFALTMTELVSLFEDEFVGAGVDIFTDHTFGFTVRGEGGIDCRTEYLSFTYQTEDVSAIYGRESADQDYIVFKDLTLQNQTTIAFKADLVISNDNGGAPLTQEKTVYYYGLGAGDNLTLTKGYWIENASNGNHFSTTDDSVAGDVVKQCYAISVNELLEEYDYGSFTIKIARVCVDDSDNFTQYQTFTFSGYKLNEISLNSLRIKDGYNLSWNWEKKDVTAGAASAGAYCVIVDDGVNVKKFQTSLTVFDLRTCGLVANEKYTVSVVAINSREDVVASSANQSREISQYSTPSLLVIEDGVIGFDISSTLTTPDTLFGDVVAAFIGGGGESEFQAIMEKTYTVPYTEKPENYHSAMVKLTFTTVNADGSEGKRYDISMPAVDLLMDCNIPIVNTSLKEKFNEYIGTLNRTSLKNFANAFVNSGEGLGSTKQLFDDKGALIPKGVYEVSMVQLGSGNNIESMQTAAQRVYLSPAPKVEINQETFNGEANQFTISVTPNVVATKSGATFTEIGAENYLMYIRSADKNTVAVQLVYNKASKTWTASCEGENLNGIDGLIIETLANENAYGIRSFKMNISKLRNALNAVLDEENKIVAGITYDVDIFAPSIDDYVLNGKSGEFTLNYQDIDASKLKVENGEISLQADFKDDLIVRYAYKISPSTTAYVGVEGGKLKLSDIANAGDLAYLTLAIKGSYSYNAIKVESEIYGFYEPYKLSKPQINSINNNLRITYSSSDLAGAVTGSMNGEISYVVENNNGGKYVSSITQNNVDYTAGLAQKDELSNEFYAYLNGNSGSLTTTLEDGEYFKYRLVFEDDNARRLIIRSERETILARMLDYQIADSQRGAIDGGHLKLTLPINDTSAIVNSDDENIQTLYKVKVDYYQNQDPSMPELMLDSKTLYFTKENVQGNVLSIDGEYISKDYDYAKVSVAAVVATYQEVQDITADSVQAVNGKYFLVADEFTYADGSYVLSSRTYNTSKLQHTTPAEAPSASSRKQLLFGGEINFVVDNAYANSDKLYVMAITSNGKKIKLDGSFTFETVLGQADKMMATFIPDEFGDDANLQALKSGSFSIQILTYDANALISKPLNINSVYKLPDIDGKYDVKVRETVVNGQVTGYQTYIDFQRYFDSFKVLGSNSIYQIKLEITQMNQHTGEEYTWSDVMSSNNYQFTMNNLMTKIDMQVVDSQPEETINRIGLFNSDKLQVVVRQTEYQDAEIEWDSENYRFTWTGGSGSEEYEYFYKAVIRQSTRNVERSGVTSVNAYEPQDMGNIAQFLIYARNKALTVGTDKVIYLFSQSIEIPSGNYAFNIFASGDGTEANPYLIQSVAGNAALTASNQFMSIAKRNNEGVYFKLMEDVEITLSEMERISSFNANLIGNSKTIKIIADEVYTMPSLYEFKFSLQTQEKTFRITRYVSLFHTIAPTATVSNLKIDSSFSLTLAGTTYAVAPLAVFNYGKIDNVTTIGNEMSFYGDSANSVIACGMVGVNYGTMAGCKNQSVKLPYVNQTLTMSILYAGIAGQNITTKYLAQDFVGALFNCENTAEVNFSMNSGTFYVAGISISNKGNILACANKGNITCKTTISNAGNFYIGGVVINSAGGMLSYCYNSGLISTENAASKLIGGVITSLNNGKINGIVDLKANNLIGYCSSTNVSNAYMTGGTIPTAIAGKVSTLNADKLISGVVTFRGANITVSMNIVSEVVSYSFSS